jgi:hypothetical protein
MFDHMETATLSYLVNREIVNVSEDLGKMVEVPYDERGDDYEKWFDRLTARRRRLIALREKLAESRKPQENPHV